MSSSRPRGTPSRLITLVTAEVPLRCMPTTMTPLVIGGGSRSLADVSTGPGGFRPPRGFAASPRQGSYHPAGIGAGQENGRRYAQHQSERARAERNAGHVENQRCQDDEHERCRYRDGDRPPVGGLPKQAKQRIAWGQQQGRQDDEA